MHLHAHGAGVGVGHPGEMHPRALPPASGHSSAGGGSIPFSQASGASGFSCARPPSRLSPPAGPPILTPSASDVLAASHLPVLQPALRRHHRPRFASELLPVTRPSPHRSWSSPPRACALRGRTASQRSAGHAKGSELKASETPQVHSSHPLGDVQEGPRPRGSHHNFPPTCYLWSGTRTGGCAGGPLPTASGEGGSQVFSGKSTSYPRWRRPFSHQMHVSVQLVLTRGM